jgi:hypothetical protein
MGGLTTARVAIREMGGDSVWSDWVNLVTENGQIAFPATQNPSAGANVLDDYEEGVWTPDLTFGGLKVGLTYGFNGGGYVKIGKKVFFSCFFGLSAKGTSTGAASIVGLPFTINAKRQTATPFFANMAATIGDVHMVALAFESSASVRPFTNGAGTNVQLTDAAFTNTSQISVSGFYEV